MESATTQIASTSETFSSVFGMNLKQPMELILNKYSETTTIIRASLEIMQSNFASILGADSAITLEILDAELDVEAITDSIRAFQEITVASKQMLLITTGLIEITKTLDSVTSNINSATSKVKSSMSLVTFTLKTEVQSARTIFGDQIRANIRNIVSAFDEYSKTSLKVFTNTTNAEFRDFLKEQQNQVDNFLQGEIKKYFKK
jgi:transposase-like protein